MNELSWRGKGTKKKKQPRGTYKCMCSKLFSSQVIILYDENQRMDLVQGKLKIAVQLPEYFGIYPSWEEALQQDLTKNTLEFCSSQNSEGQTCP